MKKLKHIINVLASFKGSGLLLLALIINVKLGAQGMTRVPVMFGGYSVGEMTYLDYDNDGDLDIAFKGNDETSTNTFKIFNYNSATGQYSDANAAIPARVDICYSFADMDLDSDLDLFITGRDDNGDPKSGIYVNSGGNFMLMDSSISPMRFGSSDWGDFDNDGDLDLLASGATWYPASNGYRAATRIYENQNMVFSLYDSSMTGRFFPSVSWVDYDNDADLDAFVAGADGTNQALAPNVYKNVNGIFSVDNLAVFVPSARPRTSWGDYDGNGTKDLLIQSIDTGPNTTIYKNLGGIFQATLDTLLDLNLGSVSWGDLNNDGKLDAVIAGAAQNSSQHTRLYIANALGGFDGFPFPPNFDQQAYSIVLGDYNKNGSLDFLSSGADSTKLFSNQPLVINAAPSAPTGISHTVNPDGSITFQWQAPTDDHTPSAGLSYSLYIGTTANGTEVCSPAADPATGYRRLVEYGDVVTTTWTLKNVDCANDYYFRVQAVDGGYMGSGFSAPLHVVIAPVASINFNGETLTASVTGAAATSYQWTDGSGTPIPGATSITYTIPTNGSYGLIVSAGACSDTVAPTPFVIIGIENPIVAAGVKIWPNPSATVLHVRVDNPGATESISIYDMQGRLMRTLSTGLSTETILPVEDLTPGLYMVKLSLADGRGLATATFRKD